MRAWRQGYALGLPDAAGTGFQYLHHAILMSLVGEASDAEVARTADMLFQSFASGSVIAAARRLIIVPPSVIRDMWRTRRGGALARQIAFREISFVECNSFPACLGALEYVRQQGTADGKLSPEQEEVLWSLFYRLWQDYLAENIQTAQVASLGMTWKGYTNFLGWGGAAPSFKPDMRAPLAYLFGLRYLKLKQPQQAAEFFREAQRLAGGDAALRTLCQASLDALAPAQK